MSVRDFVEKDYYKALSVPKDASAAEIKKSYRKLARKFHPDANKGSPGSEDRFKEISEAYDVLSDDQRRKEYDEARSLFAGGGFRMPRGQGPSPAGAGGFSFDLADLLNGASAPGAGGAGGFGDLFGGLFGAAGRRPGTSAGPRRGRDITSEVTLSFSDAVGGVTVPLRLAIPGSCTACYGSGAKPGTVPRVCPTCSGTGTVGANQGGFAFAEPCQECLGRGLLVDEPCPVCAGTGKGITERTLTVRIPAGVAEGQHIRLRGKGTPGERGGPAGDLNVAVHVTPHPVFSRSGDNLALALPVTFPEAALGATVKVPTLDGPPVTLRLPAGTTNGRTLRVRGKGVTRRDGSRGDLLVTVEVAVPQKLSGKAREALEAFAAEAADDPRAHLTAMAGGAG